MKALLYMLFLTYKNSIKQLLVNPGKLIFTIAIIALLVFTIVFGGSPEATYDIYSPISELSAMALALYLLIFITSANTGFNRGASFYSMSDVNILFTSPFASQKILIYGLIKQIGMSLWVGFFLIFQYSWLSDRYGISIVDLLAIILGYCLVFFTGQLTAMAIYIFISGNEKRRNLLKSILIGLGIALALLIGIPIFSVTGNKMAALVIALGNDWINYIPIVGWIKAAADCFLFEKPLTALLWLLPLVGYVLLFVYAVSKSHADYYEDVLSASEYTYNIRNAAQSGQIAENIPTNIKTGKSGFQHGYGAWIFFFKHLRENRRTKIPFIDTGTLMNVLAVTVFTLIMQENGILAIFIFATYMQIFAIAMGRWNRELHKHYVYLIPQSNFHKLLGIIAESVMRFLPDAILVMGIVGLILQLPPLDIICCIIARFGFALIILAGNILSERTMGGLNSKMMLVMLYFILLIIVAAPGIILAVVLAQVFGLTSIFAGLAISCIWNISVSTIIMLGCRNILRTPEIKTL